MEAILSAIGVAGTATASTAAAAGTAVAGTASTWGAVQGGLTIASAVSSLLGGAMALQQGEQSAKFQSLEAERSELEARERSLRIRRETVEKIGATRVAFAGSGLDISGSGAIEQGLENASQFEQDLARAAGQYGKARGQAGASNARSQGMAGAIAAGGRGFSQLANYYVSTERRGGPSLSGAARGTYRSAQEV